MKTVCIECRQYEEWGEEIREKILEKHRDINVRQDTRKKPIIQTEEKVNISTSL